jgi:hypothetical protein
MQFETGTVKPVPNLVNDISFLIFNKCQEGFLVFSPVWIPRRDLHCISRHHTPTHNRHRSGEGGRALLVTKLRFCTIIHRGDRANVPGPRQSTRPVLQTLASAEVHRRAYVSALAHPSTRHSPRMPHCDKLGCVRRCAAHL